MNKTSTFKSIIAAFAMTTLSFFSFGQILLSEGFESGTFPPTGWTTIDNDTSALDNWDTLDLAGYSSTFSPVSGTYVAASRSWIGPGAGTGYAPDNWLITPQLSITDAGTVLKFNGLGTWGTPSTGNGDFLEVYVSTLGTAMADFQSIFSQAFASETWEEVNLNLGTYVGQNIYIAFRHHNCFNEEVLALDEIEIAAPYVDLGIASLTNLSNGYTSIPVTQSHDLNIEAVVRNFGNTDVSSFSVTSNIYLDPDYTTPIQTYTTPGSNLTVGSTVNLTAGVYTPTAVGTYVVIHNVTATNDISTTNDTLFNYIAITDNEYARDLFDYANALGSNGTTGVTLGQTFNITNSTRLDSVLFLAGPTRSGGTISVVIRGMVNGLPDSTTVIGQSLMVPITTADSTEAATNGFKVYSLSITDPSSNPLVLAPGNYFVGVRQSADAGFMALFYSSGIVTSGTNFYSGSALGDKMYADLEDFNFFLTPIIRPFISDPNSVAIVSNDTDNTICIGQTITLTSSASTGNQWNMNGSPITGANANTYTVTASGSYTTTVGTSTSNTITATAVDCSALNENEIGGLSVYPNPTSGLLTVSAADFNGFNSIIVKDQVGRNVVNATKITSNVMTFDLTKLATGTYFVELSGNGIAKEIVKVQVTK